MSHYDTDHDDYNICAEDMRPIPIDDEGNEIIKECPYSEDVYCEKHYPEHMKEYHHFYYTKVLEIKTQHKDKTKSMCIIRIKEFTRAKMVIDKSNNKQKKDKDGIYWVKESSHGSVTKFDYTEMSHDNFMDFHYPAFIKLKNRDNSEASREAIC